VKVLQRPNRPTSTTSRNLDPLPIQQHRLRAGVSLDQIIEKTKISRRFLQAIEAGDYKQLPGGIFTVSYLRQYAAAIGFDADELLEHYERWQKGPSGPEPEESPSQGQQTQSILRLARFLMS
jgi:cytoskeletal protein RodZ